MKKAGIFIMIAGLVMTIFTAFTFFTREKVVDIGSLEITADKPHHVRWSPLIGIATMAAGGIIFFIPQKK